MNKLLFFIKRPCVIRVVGRGRSFAAEIISKILNNKKVLIFESHLPEFFLKKSRQPILVVTDSEDKKEISDIKRLAKIMPSHGFLVLNFDRDQIRDIRNVSVAQSLSYGFFKKADLQISDVNVSDDETNFKINYQGNIVPFWFKYFLTKEQIYSILSAIAVGVIRDINLVEMSQSLKEKSPTL